MMSKNKNAIIAALEITKKLFLMDNQLKKETFCRSLKVYLKEARVREDGQINVLRIIQGLISVLMIHREGGEGKTAEEIMECIHSIKSTQTKYQEGKKKEEQKMWRELNYLKIRLNEEITFVKNDIIICKELINQSLSTSSYTMPNLIGYQEVSIKETRHLETSPIHTESQKLPPSPLKRPSPPPKRSMTPTKLQLTPSISITPSKRPSTQSKEEIQPKTTKHSLTPGENMETRRHSLTPGEDKETRRHLLTPGEDKETRRILLTAVEDKETRRHSLTPGEDKETRRHSLTPGEGKESRRHSLNLGEYKKTRRHLLTHGDGKETRRHSLTLGEDKESKVFQDGNSALELIYKSIVKNSAFNLRRHSLGISPMARSKNIRVPNSSYIERLHAIEELKPTHLLIGDVAFHQITGKRLIQDGKRLEYICDPEFTIETGFYSTFEYMDNNPDIAITVACIQLGSNNIASGNHSAEVLAEITVECINHVLDRIKGHLFIYTAMPRFDDMTLNQRTSVFNNYLLKELLGTPRLTFVHNIIPAKRIYFKKDGVHLAWPGINKLINSVRENFTLHTC